MKATPKESFQILGTGITLTAGKAYPFEHAINQPDWESKGLIFITGGEGDTGGMGVLLERGEYEIA